MRRRKTASEPAHAKVLGRSAGVLESLSDAKWAALEERAAILRSAGDEAMTRATAQRAAQALGVHPTTIYRWRKRLLEAGLVTALEDRKRGFPRGRGRLSEAQERVIAEVIEASLQRSAPTRGVDLVEEVARRCVRAGVPTPSRRAVERRWKRAEEARAAGGAAPGSFHVSNPLDVVQIDHTVSDVMVVDDLYRAPIGRPYLTVALDVATRSVLAAMLSFDAPSAATVALCLMRVANPKTGWLASLGLADIDWPMAGLPRSLHLDNAPEFHSKALARGCAQFGIELIYRPVGRPHFGGHIERSIGTLMSRFKTLPGATGSSTRDRKRRRPEKTAVMTLADLERWLAVEIGERYHHRPHKGLQNATPFAAWTAHSPAAPSPAQQLALAWAFLPAVSRVVRPDGVHFQHICYWHPIFSQWALARRAVLVHYDPRDLSRIYVRADDATFLDVACGELNRPAVSLWEVNAAAHYLRSLGEKVREERLFAAIERQREIVRAAAGKTRKARAQYARHQEHSRRGSTVAPGATESPAGTPELQTPTDEAPAGDAAYSGEIWPTRER